MGAGSESLGDHCNTDETPIHKFCLTNKWMNMNTNELRDERTIYVMIKTNRFDTNHHARISYDLNASSIFLLITSSASMHHSII